MMNPPFHMPHEYVQGLLDAGQRFMAALAQPQDAQALSGSALAQLNQHYLQQQAALWTQALSGGEPAAGAERGDRRFHAAEWREQPAYRLLKQGYLLNARWLTDLVETLPLDPDQRHRLRFYMRQFVDAMCPVNFAAANPEVLKLAADTQGASLQTGLQHLLQDLRKGALTITDETAFEVGKNVAVSEGAVVFENELFQLIQYAPLTPAVAARPLLIVPPCINKFYILDLQPSNSFVRFAVEQGQTVFVVSWRNPDASAGHLGWDDYVERGAMLALDLARQIAHADKVNAVGWCVGGTILSSALAVMSARGQVPVASLTLLTTMLDFREPGDLGVFIDAQSVAMREQTIGGGGIYPGAELAFVFQALRANDLIWPNVINHYLKGKPPGAFDLLYWNADATNLPGPMYAWYLRHMYLENRLKDPGALQMCGSAVDLGRIELPSYVLATHEDHIVPWRSAYRSTQLLGGSSTFVLGASGHIAGVINPASKNRRSYWTGGAQGDDAEAWLASAIEQPGSWWTHWMAWLAPRTGAKKKARKRLGNAQHPPIEPAPGRYVKVRADAVPGAA